jgi:hypothetical protein
MVKPEFINHQSADCMQWEAASQSAFPHLGALEARLELMEPVQQFNPATHRPSISTDKGQMREDLLVQWKKPLRMAAIPSLAARS